MQMGQSSKGSGPTPDPTSESLERVGTRLFQNPPGAFEGKNYQFKGLIKKVKLCLIYTTWKAGNLHSLF